MATIITKNSQTASAVPNAASLSVGELAVNTADGKLYTEHTGGVVKEIIPSTVVDGGITEAKIASNAVTTAKIADSAVTTAKIANANVTVAKLSATGTPSSTTFLRGDGSWTAPAGGASGGQVFTSSGTFTVPSGVTAVKVTLCGGGGGGWFNGGASAGGTSSFGGYVSATGGANGVASPANGGTTSGADFGLNGGQSGQSDGSVGYGAGGGAGGIVKVTSIYDGSGTQFLPQQGMLGGSSGARAANPAASGYGNGGACDSDASRAGGGGGGYAIKYVTGLTSGGTVSVTVGARGTSADSRGNGTQGIVFVEW
jgi:hypothetical protein